MRNSRHITAFVDDLIGTYGYKSFDQLSNDDRAEFAAILNSATPKIDEMCCLTDSPNADKLMHSFRNALHMGTPQAITRFFEEARDTAIDYYHNHMEVIFDEVMADRKAERAA